MIYPFLFDLKVNIWGKNPNFLNLFIQTEGDDLRRKEKVTAFPEKFTL